MGSVIPLKNSANSAYLDLRNLVSNKLDKVENLINLKLESKVDLIQKMTKHHLNSGGKRLRALLTLGSAKLAGYDLGDRDINLASCVELIHSATLLHDDVIDESDLRRGNKTTNAIWGNQSSILTGDYLLSRCFEIMVEDGDLEVLKLLSSTSSKIAQGEVLQLQHKGEADLLEETYIKIINLKTAALFSAATTIFLFCVTSFGVILILGGPKNSTIETEIWRQAIWRGEISTASAFASIQLLVVILLSWTLTKAEKQKSSSGGLSGKRRKKTRKRTLAFHLTYLFCLFGLPVLILIERSLGTGKSNLFTFFTGLTKRTNIIPITPIDSLWNSLRFALLATLIASFIGLVASTIIVHGSKKLSTFLNVSTSIPLGISAVTIGFGIFLSFTGPLTNLRSSQWMIPSLHALLGVPFVVRSVVPTMRRIPTLLHENSQLLGVRPIKSWFNIDFKLSLRSLLVGGGFSFAISLGEFGATSFLPRNPDTLTAPLVIYRLLSTPGQELRGQAMALSVILACITSLSIFLIEMIKKMD